MYYPQLVGDDRGDLLAAWMSIDPSTGTISGLPLRTGRSVVTINASDDNATTSTVLLWDVAVAGSIRYVRLEALTEAGGGTNSVVA